MLKRVFDGALGAYMPGFFNIELDIELHDGFDWNDFKSQEKATLIHEYIHYLQDISTTQGLANFNYLVEYINLYLYKIYHSEKVINVPFDLENSQVENAYRMEELRGIYSGADKKIKIHHINRIVEDVEECYQIQFNPKISRETIYLILIFIMMTKTFHIHLGIIV